MPVMRCISKGKQGWKFGEQGKCYIGSNAKQKAILQGLAITKGTLKDVDHFDAKANTETFREILTQQRLSLSKKQRQKPIKNNQVWLYPHAIEKSYSKYITNIMRQFTSITVKEIKNSLADWNKEVKQDAYPDDLKDINKEWANLQKEIFGEDENNLDEDLLNFAILISLFNKKQWQKILNNILNIDYIPIETWEPILIDAWVNENVRLIKGLTDEYIKKINFTVNNAFTTNMNMGDLAKELTKINKQFVGYRSRRIAKDQIGKLNGKFTEKRQNDAGVSLYIWQTVGDERVRTPAHKVMNNKLCKWSDTTVYANINEYEKIGNKAWKSRSSISGVQLHPGIDIQCRCSGIPYFNDILNNIDKEIEKLQQGV